MGLLKNVRFRGRHGRPRQFSLALALLLALGVLLPTAGRHPAPANAAEPLDTLEGVTPQQIEKAIADGVAYLYAKQKEGKHWETDPQPESYEEGNSVSEGQWGGRTAMTVYTLLACGQSPSDPKLAPAIDWMMKADLRGSYSIAMRMQALLYLPPTDEVKRLMVTDYQRMLVLINQEPGPGQGHFPYTPYMKKGSNNYSHSRSQYGVLGVWAAAQMGVDVPEVFWRANDAAWRRNQDPSGGWRYKHYQNEGAHDVTPGMTAAGLASLFITTDYLNTREAAACRGNQNDPSVEAGLKWLTENFDKVATNNRYDRDFPFATVYAVERVGVASGLKYLGEHDWYSKGAAWLVKTQQKDGSWKVASRWVGDVPSACFSLLFLSRGGSPLMAYKLQYDVADRSGKTEPGNWNQRPRDLANLARAAGSATERELHWQITDLSRDVTEWMDAPLLYISGDQALSFSDEQKQKLRQYAEMGGLLVFHADCGKRPFAASVRELAKELFPDHAMEELPAEHPVFTDGQFKNWGGRPPRVEAVSNGARLLMVSIPQQDLARAWQTNSTRGRGNEEAFGLGVNLFLYASDNTGGLRKGLTHLIEPDASVKTSKTVTVGRLKHQGNWNPEPYGWERLAKVMASDYRTELQAKPVDPAAGDELSGLDVVHLTGTGEVTLDPKTRQALKAFVDNGGTLLVDAAGGDGEFATAVEAELGKVFGDDAKQLLDSPLPQSHALYAPKEGLPDLDVKWRTYSYSKLGAVREPMLRGMEKNGRLAVVYSPQDLSVGLVGMPVGGVLGYAPETATTLAARVLHGAAK